MPGAGPGIRILNKQPRGVLAPARGHHLASPDSEVVGPGQLCAMKTGGVPSLHSTQTLKLETALAGLAQWIERRLVN